MKPWYTSRTVLSCIGMLGLCFIPTTRKFIKDNNVSVVMYQAVYHAVLRLGTKRGIGKEMKEES